MDNQSKAILETIGNAGYVITVGANDLTAQDDTHRYIIRYQNYDDLYQACVTLAVQAGVDLDE